MKKIMNVLLVSILAAGLLNSVEAQRGGNHGSDRGGGGRSFSASSPSNSNNRGSFSERGFSNPGSEMRSSRPGNTDAISRSATYRHQDGRSDAINTNRVISPNQQRNDVTFSENRGRDNFNTRQQRVYPSNNVVRQQYQYRGGYGGYNNYNNFHGGGYYPRYFGYGPRYSILPRSFVSINFGGYPYYYNNGLFYGLYGGYYQSLFPPPGLSIGILPYGYSRIFVGDDPFYYYNGIYYQQDAEQNNYEVVDAPMGATVSSLPKGAKSVVLNGEKLYELNGTYYKEDRNNKGQTVYTVVGKNGEVNNTDDTSDNPANVTLPSSMNNGDVINQLPEGSKIVTINGQKLYVTPDNTYLKEQSNGDMVQYQVVGK